MHDVGAGLDQLVGSVPTVPSEFQTVDRRVGEIEPAVEERVHDAPLHVENPEHRFRPRGEGNGHREALERRQEGLGRHIQGDELQDIEAVRSRFTGGWGGSKAKVSTYSL
jgi:hypothetical protein